MGKETKIIQDNIILIGTNKQTTNGDDRAAVTECIKSVGSRAQCGFCVIGELIRRDSAVRVV
jgi:hypothetical protein